MSHARLIGLLICMILAACGTSTAANPSPDLFPTYWIIPTLDILVIDASVPEIDYIIAGRDPELGQNLVCFGEPAGYDPSGELPNGAATRLPISDAGYDAGYLRLASVKICRDYQRWETATAPDGRIYTYGHHMPSELWLPSRVLQQPGVWHLSVAEERFSLDIEVPEPIQPMIAQTGDVAANASRVYAAGFDPGEAVRVILIYGTESTNAAAGVSPDARPDELLYELEFVVREGQAADDGVIGPFDIASSPKMAYVVGESGHITGYGSSGYINLRPIDSQGDAIPREEFFALLYETLWPDS